MSQRQPLGYNPGVELTQVIASPNIQGERAGHDPRASNAYRLAEALGIAMPVVEKFAQDYERQRLEEQTAKLDHFKATFAQDRAEGAVSLAQVKARLPETVPTIAARIAEGMGKQDAERQMAAVIEEINGNDAIRLDSGKRAAFIQQKRAEMFGKIPKGHEFYSSGFAAGVEAQLQQWGNSWQREAAAFHEKVQGDELGKEVVAALNSGQPLEPIDSRWAGSSSLNHVERNKIVVDTVIDTAFTNDQPELLKKVPTLFLNAAAKDALRKAEHQITEVRLSTVRQAEYLKNQAKAQELNSLKTEITQDLADGKPIDPRKYRSNPEAFEYALRMRDMPVVDEPTSASRAALTEQEILNGSTVGSGESLEQLTERVRLDTYMTPQHKQSLIAKLPKLMEGRTLMEDPTVRQPINDRLNPRLQELSSSTNSMLQTLTNGRNLRAEVMKQYDNELRLLFKAEFEDTGKWPTGHRKIELIDKAVDRAEATLEKWTKIGGAGAREAQSQAGSAAVPPNPRQATQRRVEVIPGVYRIE